LYYNLVKIKDENFLMKTKELKKIATKLANLELLVEQNNNAEDVKKAQKEIMDISGRIKDPEDMFLIDEFIQEILKEKNS